MKMTVSPKEIAEHLISEMGHQAAEEACKYHLGRCTDEETSSVWNSIGLELSNLQPN